MHDIKTLKKKNEYFIDLISNEESIYSNLHDIFIRSVLNSPDSNFLGTIIETSSDDLKNKLNIQYLTYKDAYILVSLISNQLKNIIKENAINEDRNDLIGILMQNKTEWILIEQSIYKNDLITVPLYSTLGLNALKHILEQTKLEILFISNINELKLIINVLKTSNKIFLKSIVSIDEIINYEGIEYLNTKSIKLIKLINFNEKNININIENSCKLKGNDLATICYTSGTSGLPKGVMITHDNIISVVNPITIKTNGFFNINNESRYFSYLPLAHMMERIVMYCFISVGSKIIFYRNKLTLAEDIKLSKPTFLMTVPRVLEVFKSKIIEKINKLSFLKRRIFWIAFYFKKAFKFNYLNVIFKPIQEAFGGSINQILCGSAPLNKNLKEFISIVFNIQIQEGYGCTEGCASNICEPYNKNKLNGYSVGVPFYTNKLKILNENGIPSNKGILYLKGRNIFKGYFKDLNKTYKVLKDGWYESGDLVEINKNGTINIIGRNNDTFKIPHGEFIVPEKIETLFHQIFPEIFITGNSLNNFLICIIYYPLKSQKEVEDKFYEFSLKLIESNYLTKIEIPKEIILSKKSFIDLQLLTPTGKLKRKEIELFFKEEIKSFLINK